MHTTANLQQASLAAAPHLAVELLYGEFTDAIYSRSGPAVSTPAGPGDVAHVCELLACMLSDPVAALSLVAVLRTAALSHDDAAATAAGQLIHVLAQRFAETQAHELAQRGAFSAA